MKTANSASRRPTSAATFFPITARALKADVATPREGGAGRGRSGGGAEAGRERPPAPETATDEVRGRSSCLSPARPRARRCVPYRSPGLPSRGPRRLLVSGSKSPEAHRVLRKDVPGSRRTLRASPARWTRWVFRPPAGPLPLRMASCPLSGSKKLRAMNKSTYLICNIRDNLLKSTSSKI